MGESGRSKKKRRGGPRRKTGCYTCKSRHSRCDEKKPVCSNCERLNLECKPSDFIAPSEWSVNISNSVLADPEGTSAIEISEPVEPLENFQPDESFTDGAFSSLVGTNDVSAQTLPQLDDSLPASVWDVFKWHVPGFEGVSDDAPPTAALANIVLPAPNPKRAEKDHVRYAIPLTEETAFLLKTYLRTVAIWMDLIDFDHTYQLSIPRLIFRSPLLLHSICAFTAKHLARANSRHHSSWEPVAREHYGKALRLLISALNSSAQENCLTATILLSSYEILDSLGEEYRRHFLGVYSLIKAHGICDRARGIDRANFWVYVRHEIGVALATERPLMLSPEEWNFHLELGEQREDRLACHVLWITARAINLVYGPDGSTIEGKKMRQDMVRELEDWRSRLPDTFIGIPYGDKDEEGFRKVYFTVTAAAVAAFWYHVAHILLYAEPTLQDESYRPYVQDQAVLIAEIAISDFPDSLRVFASHGLYFAAKHITGIARKARLWNILNDVETQLGHHTRSYLKRLQDLVEQGFM
ncbi:hypothetical protein BDV96DRAFT_605609 [Lophiotrema nucula]|uniref:Zn(2)-C6 fungal-type domain-containing protein n=1 Tax=Lophiotrema nucula TaxID=690887 RepID=A0A6A5YP97_9PLEO|nr:hypothetical protein BDV96DRAFT_605609 [Lophiotrema nucula]